MDRRIDKLTNLPPELREEIKARAAARQAQSQSELSKLQAKNRAREEQLRAESQVASFFKVTDQVTTIDRTPDGKPILNSSPYTIARAENPKGDVVYFRSNKGEIPSQDQLSDLSGRIKIEEAEFKTLDQPTQSKILREGSTKYGTYLSNEKLRQQLQRLKSAPKDGFTI